MHAKVVWHQERSGYKNQKNQCYGNLQRAQYMAVHSFSSILLKPGLSLSLLPGCGWPPRIVILNYDLKKESTTLYHNSLQTKIQGRKSLKTKPGQCTGHYVETVVLAEPEYPLTALVELSNE